MKILETERLILKEMTGEDFGGLCAILRDEEVMYAYEHAFSENEAREWLLRNLKRYRDDGFGLWAVELKQNGEFIGQCGLTFQEIPGKKVVEIGYLFRKEFWHKGFAVEAASACKRYAFENLSINEVYSIIRVNNYSSIKVAKRNGMTEKGRFVKHYHGIDMPHIIFSAEKETS